MDENVDVFEARLQNYACTLLPKSNVTNTCNYKILLCHVTLCTKNILVQQIKKENSKVLFDQILNKLHVCYFL